MLTMQALTKSRITVFGGNQTRPNIHIKDMVDVYLHFINNENNSEGTFNAGFENISILDIAKRITEFVPAKIVINESNDPRSYRLNYDKLKETGFMPKYGIEDGIQEIIEAFRSGKLIDNDDYYNIKTMKHLLNSNKLRVS
jgi:nucleoside-diphosphate-sugar epimerase